MGNDRATDLANHCTELLRKGKSFSTVWHTVLKRHTLIDGIPSERFDGQRNFLDIPLITGDRLVFDRNAKEFRLE